jgi:hypothetical protein
MKIKYIQWAIVFAVLFLLLVIFIRAGRRSNLYGTLMAVHASLVKMVDQKELDAELYFNDPQTDWKKMPDSLFDQLMIQLNQRDNIDPPKGWNADKQPLVDPWGNRLQIWYKAETDRGFSWLVISIGPDGRPGTADDIVSVPDAGWGN